MNFLHLFAFNLAMLVKQGWRFLHNPISLVCHLFKVIYFPTSFWNDATSPSPSYAWWSILHGREILSASIRRHVGNELSTYVWNNPWLLAPISMKIVGYGVQTRDVTFL